MPDACSTAAGVQEQAGLGPRREPLWRAGRRVVMCERAAVAGAPSKGATRVLRTLGRT